MEGKEPQEIIKKSTRKKNITSFFGESGGGRALKKESIENVLRSFLEAFESKVYWLDFLTKAYTPGCDSYIRRKKRRFEKDMLCTKKTFPVPFFFFLLLLRLRLKTRRS